MGMVKEDIKYLDKVISMNKITELYKNYFCWLYPFTNENINGYYSKIDFENKNVLTITGSGDHILNAFLLGAKEVDAFDSNPLAKYYTELKIASIKSLSLEEFVLFFYNNSTFKIPKYYLNKETYVKIRKNLDDKYLEFWDYVFRNYSPKELYKSYLFTDDFLSLDALACANLYFNVENYETLRECLRDKKVEYHDIGLENLCDIEKRFDIIILSNVPAFLNKVYKSDFLNNFRDLIDKIKHFNTKIVVCYLYSNLLESGSSKDDIYNNRKLREYFPNDEYEYMHFESSDTLGSKSGLKKIFPKFDSVFISK